MPQNKIVFYVSRPRMSWSARLLILFVDCLSLVLLLRYHVVSASEDGRVGFSGNPGTNGGASCNTCHTPGSAIPSAVITGPTTVAAGTSNTYRDRTGVWRRIDWQSSVPSGSISTFGLDSRGELVLAERSTGKIARLADPVRVVLDKALWMPLVMR